MAKILVVGSANMDITYAVKHIPAPGETVIALSKALSPGGKGANQAVAAARLGGDVAFLGRVGADAHGEALLRSMREAGVDVSNAIIDAAHPTGTAMICVAEDGQNCITVDPGANAAMSADDVWDHSQAFAQADYVIVQLEIGYSAVQAAVTVGKMMDKYVILNPAPARELEPELLSGVNCLVPNETEADTLFRGYQREQLPVLCRSCGLGSIVVTLGAKGALLTQDGALTRCPAMRVKAVDATGAGDCFVGALAVALSEGRPLTDAVEFANQAAALSTTKKGAQASMPARDEVDSER